MPSATVTETAPVGSTKIIRKRKTHTKSRRGCGNCKLRRVKCDENRPECKRCTNFGVSCSYDGKTDLEPSMEVSISIPINNTYNEQVLSFFTSPQPEAAGTSSEADSEFEAEDHAVLERFKNRTMYSIGTESSQHLYGRVLPELAMDHNFLFHLVVTLTLMHDRFLEDVKLEELTKQSESEAYHWYQGTVIFNTHLRTLYTPTNPRHLDAMWGAAVCLGCIAFFCTDADTPSQSWPLKPPGPLDLDWLKISDGKKEVWRVANPLGPESAYNALAAEQISLLAPALLSEPVVPEGWRELWGAHPYKRAASVVGGLMGMEMTRRTVLHFLSFVSHVEGDFARLLEARDPKAMLLLGMWYAKVCRYRQWWTMRRAVLEGQAIVIYLEREHGELVGEGGKGRHLWDFVRRGTGLERGWGWRDFAREAGLGETGQEKESMCQRAGFGMFRTGEQMPGGSGGDVEWPI